MYVISKTGFRFAIVGLANTAIGYAVILAGLFSGLNDFTANALGYAVGLTISFLLNRNWTYRVPGNVELAEIVRFMIAFALSWSINIAVISIGVSAGYIGNPFLHLLAIAAYSLSFFLFSGVFVFKRSQPSVSLLVREYYPEISIGAVSLTLFGLMYNIALTHDVIWQLWIGRQMLNGVGLYSQIIELNPPLWFWMALPAQLASNIFHIPANQILVGFILMLCMVSALLVGRLGLFERSTERLFAMIITLLLTATACLYDFGQREQIALAATIPYIFLIVRRAHAMPTSLWLAIVTTMVAAMGLALKHYFAVVPALMELLLFLHLRKNYRPFRSETLTLAGAAISYIALIFWLTPEFITTILPMISIAYFGYEVPIRLWFDEPVQVLWLLSLVAIVFVGLYRSPRQYVYVQAFLLAAFGFFIAYLAQGKGWQYHAIPVSGMLVMAIAASGFEVGRRVEDFLKQPLAALIIFFYFGLSQSQGTYASDREELYSSTFANTPPGSSIMVVASNPMWIWPMIENTHRVWPSRYFAHWMIPAIGYHRKVENQGPEMEKLAAKILADTDTDIRCNPPAIILIEKGEPNYTVRPSNFDTLAFIQENKNIKSYLSRNYTEHGTDPWLRQFKRVTPFESDRPVDCRKIF